MTGQPYSKEQQLGARRKKYRRSVAGPKRWQQIIDEKAQECRACGSRDLVDPHHIVRRGSPHFGDDQRDNVIGLCRDCHDEFHRSGPGSRIGKILRYRLTDAEVAYATQRGGEHYLDERYFDPFTERGAA